MTALRTFLLGALPAPVEVVRGQDNRVPEPTTDTFVVMTPSRRARLATNTETWDAHASPPANIDRLQPTQFDVQLDFHGDASADNAQIFSTVWRSSYATSYFASINPAVAPLFCDDGQQMPFVNGEGQYEQRWLVRASLQINPVVSTPQEFADSLTVDLVSVDATYPPGA